MKKQIFFLIFAIPLFCMAQPKPMLDREYIYDEAGNRILRRVLQMTPINAPMAPQDSIEVDPFEPEYFVEKIAQVEIRIYPNPTTEKITLEISNMEKLQTGNFTLFSLTGQLLQEQPVHSATTIVSLANLPKGAYILKVHINDKIEDWKIIKN
jgi:hypothetical protein